MFRRYGNLRLRLLSPGISASSAVNVLAPLGIPELSALKRVSQICSLSSSEVGKGEIRSEQWTTRATRKSTAKPREKSTALLLEGLSAKTQSSPEDEDADAAIPQAPPSRSRTPEIDSSPRVPARLLPLHSAKHNDLNSFLMYAEEAKLNPKSSVYKGTHYEYTVARVLQAFDFTLQRTGRSNDLGIDLVGHWRLPHHKSSGHASPVLVQCKATRPTPSMVRELEGAYIGAPSGWRGDDTLALLVADKESTEGVRAAVQRSRWPMGMLQISREGAVNQFFWNAAAAHIGLEGLGVTVRHSSDDVSADAAAGGAVTDEHITSSIALTWMGKLWRISVALAEVKAYDS